MRRSLLAVLTALAVFALAASASAAVRYATPGGVKTGACNPTACDLARAANLAADGDQVIVGPGIYKPAETIEIAAAATVGGEAGAPLPVVQTSEAFFYVQNAGAVLHDLRVEVVTPTMPYAVTIEAGTVERVFAYSTQSAGACGIASGTIRDSVCLGGLVASGSGGTPHIVLRNVTATDVSFGSSSGAATTIDGANLILRSGDPGYSEGADLSIDVSSGSSGTFALRNSNYATVNTGPSSGTDFTYTAPGTEGNQTAAPQFVDLAGGDLRELPGSPTVDGGTSDPLLGATDLDGHARSQPACIGGTPVPDIGAYELTPTVACPKAAGPPAPPAGPTGSVKLVRVKLNKSKGTATLLARVSGPGTLTLTGKKVLKRAASARGAGVVKLAIAAKGKAKKLLDSTGKARIAITVAFTPTGGTATSTKRKLTLVKAPRG